jgi:hypothetical protein
LLVGRINLSLTTRKKEIISARKECVEISLGLEAKALEPSKLIKQTAPDDQDVFLGRVHDLAQASRSRSLNASRHGGFVLWRTGGSPTLKRIGHAYLWPEQIQARIWIGLSAIGEMLVEHTRVQFPMIV